MPTPHSGKELEVGHGEERDEIPEESLLWAVSYADLLMVMLAFFVIFFEFKQVTDNQPMEKMASELEKKAGLAMTGDATAMEKSKVAPEPVTEGQMRAPVSIPELKKIDKTMFTIKKDGKEKDIIIELPDDIYEMGEYALTPSDKAEVDRVLDVLRPYADNVALVFVGHTDEVPVRVFKNHIIDSNMVLSNLRSSYAVNYAVSKGFDARWVYAQGVGEYSRNTRSLSIRVLERAKN
jgi:flagellar motor protein MotB